jgi:hypothetical protein
MTRPDTPGGEAAWGERRREGAERPGGERPGGEPPRTAAEQLADLLGDPGRGPRSGHGSPPPPPPRSGPDLSALFVLLDLLRRAAPSDLQDRVAAMIREVLLTLRSLIDWYLERLDNPAREPRVEDIPIE